ncbi:MAG: hypothetical protein RMK29_00405 [Myxococcales bacterium]|nr:hypothetical protein [Myxococcota bacterium]MDW8280137.1 hypothetical protein [Myxococcales bacterium]
MALVVLLALVASAGMLAALRLLLRWVRRRHRYSPWPEVGWLTPEESPLGRRVLDCRGYCKLMPGPPRDKIVERFQALRRMSLEQLRDCLPEGSDPAGYELSWDFNEGEALRLRAGFHATDVEDRWLIRYAHGRLYFQRSWTGVLVYVAEIRPEHGGARLTRLWLRGSDSACPEQRLLHIAIVRYLIDSHLLGRLAAVPVPSDLASEPLKMALFAFSIAGRRGEYAEPFYPDSAPPH